MCATSVWRSAFRNVGGLKGVWPRDDLNGLSDAVNAMMLFSQKAITVVTPAAAAAAASTVVEETSGDVLAKITDSELEEIVVGMQQKEGLKRLKQQRFKGGRFAHIESSSSNDEEEEEQRVPLQRNRGIQKPRKLPAAVVLQRWQAVVKQQQWQSNEFIVNEVLARRCVRADGEMEYFVSWKGYGPSENSWEPARNFYFDVEAYYSGKY